MRRRAARSVLSGMGLALVLALASGCPVTSAENCDALGTCGSSTGDPTTSSGSGSTSSVPAACLGFELDDVVGEECGLFVAPDVGSDEADGSRGAPFATLTKAISASIGKPIYVCAGTLKESVTITLGANVFGGFKCDGWVYTGEKTGLRGDADAIAVRLDTSSNASFTDFTIEAPDAVALGASSLAILVGSGSALELNRVDVTAGKGAPGIDGVTPEGVGPNGEAQDGVEGDPGDPGCTGSAAVVNGGLGGISQCGDTSTAGGVGGIGTKNSGGDGSAGEPAGGTGIAGTGSKVGGAPCTDGGNGSFGETGLSGAGATGAGTLASTGFSGASGEPGAVGKPGQGGGGGGGGKVCGASPGPSGGGGGAGGCGGAGGPGGGAGGSSIGIAAFDVKAVLLTSVTITTHAGGKGGKGAAGQDGGFGGQLGALGANGACNGGKGGNGGPGGAGGGGRGGHSAGIVWTVTEVSPGDTEIKVGAAAPGGAGGDFTNHPAPDGLSGLAQPVVGL